MNKYKMISICSLTIVCVLVLSILIPNRTDANDKESIEMSMHYENSQVSANITVNSDIYTGIVCKYIMVDNVYQSEDLLAQTKEKGTTINLDKSESNKYEAVISNVTKRYVVIYVSIGNCSLCDYIDCKINQKEDNKEQNTPSKGENMSVVGEGTNGQIVEASTGNKEENKQEKPAEPSKEENKQEKPAEPSKEENKQEKPAEPSKEENKQEKPAEPSKEENKQEKPAEPSKEENKQEKPAEASKEENKQEKPAEPSKEENKQEKPAEPSKEENKQEKPAEPSKEENKQEKPAEASKEENKQEKPTTTSKEENKTEQNKENDKLVVDNKTETSKDFETIEDVTNKDKGNANNNSANTQNGSVNNVQNNNQKPQTTSKPAVVDKDTIGTNNQTSSNSKPSVSGDKDKVDTSNFEEIDKTVTSSTADKDMPKTGEDDFAKILGIVVFSIISAYSFYKYKTTK